MNKQKTEGIWLGKNLPRNLENLIKWSNEPIKSLGIYFEKDKKQIEDLNWKPRLTKLENILSRWKVRKLTYYGKITIIKTLGISQILYNASCINVPDYVIKVLNKTIYRFLWGSGKEKVKRSTTTKDMVDGGLRMINIENQINALKLKWVSRMLDGKNTGVLKRIVNHCSEPLGGFPFLLELNCKSDDVSKLFDNKIPPFYQGVLKAWYTLQEKRREVRDVHENDIMWGNTNVRYKGQVFFYTKWINAGILRLKDIVTGDRFINLTELSTKIKCPKNMFNLYKLMISIPENWKKVIKKRKLSSHVRKENTTFIVYDKERHISELQTKNIYGMLNINHEDAVCIKHWKKQNIGENKD